MKLYLAVTADELELPIMVEESAKELGRRLGISSMCVCQRIKYGGKGKISGMRLFKVDVEKGD